MMKRIWVLLAFCVTFLQPCLAAAPVANTQCVSIAAADTTITLGSGGFRHIQIWTDLGASDVYVELNNATATVGGATTIKIEGGGSWSSPPGGLAEGVTTFHYIGSGTTGKMSVLGTR